MLKHSLLITVKGKHDLLVEINKLKSIFTGYSFKTSTSYSMPYKEIEKNI